MVDLNKDNILVTGFGPFRDHVVNASWEAVKELPNLIEDHNVVKLEIPVTYEHVEAKIPSLWRQLDPVLVLHVGVSSFASKLTLEKCAHRDGYSSLDCLGNKHPTGQACCVGDDCIYTGINLDEIVNNLTERITVASCISHNAGMYLCEFIYYTSLKIDRSRTLFVHVPPINEPYSTNEVMEALKHVISLCLKQIKERESVQQAAVGQ